MSKKKEVAPVCVACPLCEKFKTAFADPEFMRLLVEIIKWRKVIKERMNTPCPSFIDSAIEDLCTWLNEKGVKWKELPL